MMYLADSAQLQELYLKGSAGGRNYVGPPVPPAARRTAKSWRWMAVPWFCAG